MITLLINTTYLLGCATQPSDNAGSTYPRSEGQRIEYKHIFVGENSGDWVGKSMAANGDVDGDGLSDVLIGAFQNDESGAGAGKAYLMTSTHFSLGNTSLSEGVHFWGENAGNCAGASVSFVDDLDGDTLSEVLISSPCANRVYLFLAKNIQTEHQLEEADYIFIGPESEDYLGWSIAGVGDVNGDQRGDFLIGADAADAQGESTGNAFLIMQTIETENAPIDISEVATKFIGLEEGENTGNAVAAAGDIDGDGLDDILIGAKSSIEGGEQSGKAYLVLAADVQTSGPQTLGNQDYQFIGQSYDDAGDSVAAGGDIDGDGKGDILIGAPNTTYAQQEKGRVYVIFGDSISPYQSLSEASAVVEGLFARDHTGYAVSSAGDIDGDQHSEILIGSPSLFNHDHGGAAYILDGNSLSNGGRFHLVDAKWVLDSEHIGAQLGYSVTLGGDIDGDDYIDLLVGAPRYSQQKENCGGIYLVSPSAL